MASLIDVNVLMALLYEDHLHTRPALDWLKEQSPKSVLICRVVQMGALRLLTKPSVMKGEVVNPAVFWKMWDRLRQDSRFAFVTEPETFDSEWKKMTSSLATGESAGTDAYLSAFAKAGGYILVTFDKGMTRFRTTKTVVLAA